MKITQVKMGLERSVRHKPYVVSTPTVTLVGEFEPGEDFELAVDSLHDEVLAIMKDMVIEEKRLFKEKQEEKQEETQKEYRGDIPF